MNENIAKIEEFEIYLEFCKINLFLNDSSLKFITEIQYDLKQNSLNFDNELTMDRQIYEEIHLFELKNLRKKSLLNVKLNIYNI